MRVEGGISHVAEEEGSEAFMGDPERHGKDFYFISRILESFEGF